MVTENIWDADVVFVYDYCYVAWWLAHIHSTGGAVRDSPGTHLIKVEISAFR